MQSGMMDKKQGKGHGIWLIAAVVIVCAVAFGIFLGMRGFGNRTQDSNASEKNTAEASETPLSAESHKDEVLAADDEALDRIIYVDGTEYHKKENITTILFMGVDDSEDTEHHETIGARGRADTIILFILNDDEKTAQMLAISRDTQTEVDVYNAKGDYVYSGVMHLTLQYSFGESRKKSCWLMKRTVSELLYGLPIDGTMSMTMDGIEKIVDDLGGLKATLPEDYTEIDEKYVKGAEVVFDGERALRFVRYRNIETTGSNDDRMNRQTWFIQTLFGEIKKAPDRGNLLKSLLDEASDYIETDLSAEQIKALGSYSLDEKTLTLPGSTREGLTHDEFIVDEEALQRLLIGIFYDAK